MLTVERLLEAYDLDQLTLLPKPVEYSTHVILRIYYDTMTENDLNKNLDILKGPCHACCRGNMDSAIGIHVACAELDITEELLRWVNWLVNESFFAEAFLVKNPVDCVTKGFMMNPNCDSEKWLAAAQLCRLGASEYKSHFFALLEIIKNRPKLDIGLLTWACLSFGVNLSADKKKISRAYIKPQTSTHLPYRFVEDIYNLKLMVSNEEGYKEGYTSVSASARNGWLYGGNEILLGYRAKYQKTPNAAFKEAYKVFIFSLDYDNPENIFGGEAKVIAKDYKPFFMNSYKKIKESGQLSVASEQQIANYNFSISAIEALNESLESLVL